MSPQWTKPAIGARPVALIGAGVLGRRIACVFAAAGYNVNIRDPSENARKAALEFVRDHLSEYSNLTKGSRSHGTYNVFPDLESAVRNAWLVIEAIPEKLQMKIDTMEALDKVAPPDCILASNSSSFKSRFMLDEVSDECRQLICNMHFTMPPDILNVELMTDGQTNEDVFPFLTEALTDVGLLPVTAQKESTGFIFNRLWAAIKREIMMILAEGVSEPGQIDQLWREQFQKPGSKAPCALMDEVGLDTVANIEDNYVQERHLDASLTTDWLRKIYIDRGKLGEKSDKGGLYPAATEASHTKGGSVSAPGLYFLDVGLGANVADPAMAGSSGRILYRSADGESVKALVSNLHCPDGIDTSSSVKLMFWTNMGSQTSTNDGSVMSASLDGSNVQEIIPRGAAHTPKQLVVDELNQKLYFSDREGLGVHRCNFDGSNHETLVKRGDFHDSDHIKDMTRWCVGIAIDSKRSKFYWTQKGPSKGQEGRIFRASMEMPTGEDASNRSDIELLLQDLPEPVDLELDSDTDTLYWTDRGEHPFGSTLNKANIGPDQTPQVEILGRHFDEPIGLKLDRGSGHMYVTDLGGSVYRLNVDGSEKTVLLRDDCCYTGITCH